MLRSLYLVERAGRMKRSMLMRERSFPGVREKLVVLLVVIFLVPNTLTAKTFRVNNGFDVNDLSPGNGLCVAYLVIIPPFVLPFCTLRGAIEEANNYPGEDSVELPSGVFYLTLEGADEDLSLTGDLDIIESLTIQGKGADQTYIDAGGIDRVVDVLGADVTLTLRDVTLLHGSVLTDGGAIRNRGNLILENSILLDNEAADQNAGRGGLLFNAGRCRISSSTLHGGRAHEGGGLFNSYGAEITVSSTTISSSSAVIGGGASNYGVLKVINTTVSGNGNQKTLHGGGVENRKILLLQHSTIAYNRALEGGGLGNRSHITMQNSIVAENDGGDCSVSKNPYSAGYNIDSDNSCALLQAGDTPNAAAGLRPLRNYGGNTRTHALYPYSPARDSGIRQKDIVADQRGVARPFGAGVDRGAFEYDGFPLAPALIPLIIHSSN